MLSNFESLEELLRVIVRSITKCTPSPLIVDIGYSATITLQVDGEDMGRCVGKNGSSIWAIQTIFWYAGLANFGFPYRVRLIDPIVKFERHSVPLQFRSDWDRVVITNLCATIISTCTPGHASFTLEEKGTTAVIKIAINKYLERAMCDPSFTEAFSTLLHTAGLNQGVNIKSKAIFK